MQELREQLEAHVVTIETLRAESKTAEAQHEKVSTNTDNCLLIVLEDT